MHDGLGTASANGVRGRATARGLVCALFACAVWVTPVLAGSGEKLVAQPAPDFALKSLSGENLRLSEYRGEVVLVNFWASWCGTCREQLPVLADLHAQYRDQGLQVLSVSIDRKSKRAEKALAGLHPAFPVLLDDRKAVSRLYDLDEMPFAMLIDEAGTVRAVYEGFDDDDRQLYQEQIAALMAE